MNSINKTAEPIFAMKTKSSCDPSKGAGAGGADAIGSGAEVIAGLAGVIASGAEVIAGLAGMIASGVEVIAGVAGATAGAADATTGAYARGTLLTGPIATQACQCVLSGRR